MSGKPTIEQLEAFCGALCVELLQERYESARQLALQVKIAFRDGAPVVESEHEEKGEGL